MRGLSVSIVLTLALAGAVSAEPAVPADPDWGATVSLEFSGAPLRTVLEAIGAAGHLHFVYDDNVDPEAPTSITLPDRTVLGALRLVTRTNRLFFVVRDTGTVLVAPSTRQKHQQYDPQGVRTFRLRHADPKSVVVMLRSLLQTRDLVEDERLKAVTMRDTTFQLDLAAELIRRIDRSADDIPDAGAVERRPLWVGTAVDADLCTLGDPVPALAVDLSQPVALDASGVSAGRLYEALSDATGIDVFLGDGIDAGRTLDLDLSGVSAEGALARLEEELGAFSVAWGPRALFVGPDTRDVRMAQEHVAIQLFFLSHADTRSVVTALRTTLQSRQIVEIPSLDLVVVRDPVERLALAQDLVAELDRPAP